MKKLIIEGKENELLEAFGCKEIKYDNLVNNYYINFTYKGKKFTLEHILNVYGTEVDVWELYSQEKRTKSFSTLKEALNYIK